MRRSLAIYFVVSCAISTCAKAVFSQELSTPSASLAPLLGADGRSPHPAWRLSTLPGGKVPATQLRGVTVDGHAVLELASDASYAALTHAWRGKSPGPLAWRWQLVQPNPQADIATKAGDDAALKVCVMFDQPLDDIPFGQRAALRLARALSGQDLPAATLCYLWDSRYPAGKTGVNPYTARVRWRVLQGAQTPLGQWRLEQRDVAADFLALFGTESAQVPPVLAVAVGADADNTLARNRGYIDALRWVGP